MLEITVCKLPEGMKTKDVKRLAQRIYEAVLNISELGIPGDIIDISFPPDLLEFRTSIFVKIILSEEHKIASEGEELLMKKIAEAIHKEFPNITIKCARPLYLKVATFT